MRPPRDLSPPLAPSVPRSSTPRTAFGARDAIEAALPGAPVFLPNPRRILWPTALTAVLLAGALFPLPALRDALNGLGFDGGKLTYSTAYIWFSPLWDLLDSLTLLTAPQHYGLVGSVLLAWVILRLRYWLRRSTPGSWWREAITGGFVLGGLVGVYAVAALVPRPMARLVVYDVDAVLVDFHSHTSASHDSRLGFDVERNRSWHRQAGFHVSYVTDHLSREGAASWREIERGIAANPERAGDGTVIARGIEARSGGEHVNILGAAASDLGMFTDGDHLRPGARLRSGLTPVIVQTIPARLANFARADIDSLTPSIAIEVNDGSPRGLAQNLRDRPMIYRMVDSLSLAPLAGSDNHGWGRTAAAWSIVQVPGWRSMSPDSLAGRIENELRTRRRWGARTIERRTPQVGPRVSELFLVVPAMIYEINATLSPQQRLSWIVWTWLLAHFGPLIRYGLLRRRFRRTSGGHRAVTAPNLRP